MKQSQPPKKVTVKKIPVLNVPVRRVVVRKSPPKKAPSRKIVPGLQPTRVTNPLPSDTLFVTSFGSDMYLPSGKPLLDSFNAYQNHGKLLVCREGDWAYTENSNRFYFYNLDTDPFLQNWLLANRDVIPLHLGGTTTQCTCPGAYIRHAKHTHGCYWQWMNRNASRWFRKVASLHAALEYKARYLVWIDADCHFINSMPATFIKDILNARTLIYCKGPHREAIESGILLFNLEAGGTTFIEKLCQRYTSREYLQDHRWDDGFQITRVVELFGKEFVTLDLAISDIGRKWKKHENKRNVIPRTSLASYLRHNKGQHGTQLDIMK